MPSYNPYSPPTVPVEPPEHVDKRSSDNKPPAVIEHTPGGGRATASIALLYVTATVEFLQVISAASMIALLERIKRGEEVAELAVAGGMMLVGGVSIVRLLLLVGCGIVFCMWFYRVYRNLMPLGWPKQEHGWRMAPGSFFIPLANLYLPYSIAKEIWIKSGPDISEARGSSATSKGHGLVSWWWAVFLFSSFMLMLSDKLIDGEPSLERLLGALYVLISASLLRATAAVLGARVVGGIERRQAERHMQLAAARSTAEQPPAEGETT